MIRLHLGSLAALGAAALGSAIPALHSHGATAQPAPDMHAGGAVAVRAGTIDLVADGTVLEGGATLVARDGVIVAVGKDVEVPPDAQLFDYGEDAVIVPGFVSATGMPRVAGPKRTAEPGLRALDDFDFDSDLRSLLVGGVTTTYVPAAENRLIGGQGAVVKLAGKDRERRTLSAASALQGAIDANARNTPGYWEPPIPASVDVGIGYMKPQLPNTTMGAILALGELLDEAHAAQPAPDSPYGPHAGPELREALASGLPWRIAATTPAEIRALLGFAHDKDLHLVLDRAWGAKDLAKDLAAAGADVVWRFPFLPGVGVDHGKDPDSRWPDFSVPGALAKAGVRFAIAPPTPRDMLFSAAAASAGGLSPAAALRAITLSPAEILGVADRVGSLQAGKDADFVVLNGPPLDGRSSVVATWVDGDLAWKPASDDSVVLAVDELHVGDGSVLRPAEILVVDGKIREIGERVSRPAGALVVRGTAAMPGIIDAMGYLGLEGSRRSVGVDYSLAQIVGPGDALDRRVAAAGITTVALTPRGVSRGGSPILPYKPAASDMDEQVVATTQDVHLTWTDRNRLNSGAEVRDLLAKAADYREKWQEYEKELAAWKPPASEAKESSAEEEKKEEASEGSGEEDKGSSASEEDKGKKSKKKKGEEELEPDPVTGVWTADVPCGDEESEHLRMRLHLVPGEGSGSVEGNLRCDHVSTDLVDVEGNWDREGRSLTLMGLGSRGWVSAVLKLEDGHLDGTCETAGETLELKAERTSKEWVVAGRSARPMEPEAEEEPAEPRGKPREPRRDDRLEPLRAVLDGKAALLIDVDRADEILASVETCEHYGVKPVLVGADDAWKVADELVGRVSGVLLKQRVTVWDSRRGTDYRTPWADLQNAGIRVAFHSDAEEGAVDLPLFAQYAIANGMSPEGALRAMTADAADMLAIGDRVGRLAVGRDADVLLLDGPPLAPGTTIQRAWVNGREVR